MTLNLPLLNCESYFQKNGNKPKKEKPAKSLFNEPQITASIPSVNEPLKVTESFDDEEDEFHVTPVTSGEYLLPNIGLLDKVEAAENEVDLEHYYEVSKKLEDKLRDFGISGKVEGISPGPVVTTYEFAPAPGAMVTGVTVVVPMPCRPVLTVYGSKRGIWLNSMK